MQTTNALLERTRTDAQQRLAEVEAEAAPLIAEREQLLSLLAALDGVQTVAAAPATIAARLAAVDAALPPAPPAPPAPAAKATKPNGGKVRDRKAEAARRAAKAKADKAAKAKANRPARAKGAPPVADVVLAASQELGPEATAAEIAAHTGLHAPTVGATLSKLRRDGKVPRRAGNVDGATIDAGPPGEAEDAPTPNGTPAPA